MIVLNLQVTVKEVSPDLLTLLKTILPEAEIQHEGLEPKTKYDFDSIAVDTYELYKCDPKKLRNAINKYNFSRKDRLTELTGKVVGKEAMIVSRILKLDRPQ